MKLIIVGTNCESEERVSDERAHEWVQVAEGTDRRAARLPTHCQRRAAYISASRHESLLEGQQRHLVLDGLDREGGLRRSQGHEGLAVALETSLHVAVLRCRLQLVPTQREQSEDSDSDSDVLIRGSSARALQLIDSTHAPV